MKWLILIGTLPFASSLFWNLAGVCNCPPAPICPPQLPCLPAPAPVCPPVVPCTESGNGFVATNGIQSPYGGSHHDRRYSPMSHIGIVSPPQINGPYIRSNIAQLPPPQYISSMQAAQYAQQTYPRTSINPLSPQYSQPSYNVKPSYSVKPSYHAKPSYNSQSLQRTPLAVVPPPPPVPQGFFKASPLPTPPPSVSAYQPSKQAQQVLPAAADGSYDSAGPAKEEYVPSSGTSEGVLDSQSIANTYNAPIGEQKQIEIEQVYIHPSQYRTQGLTGKGRISGGNHGVESGHLVDEMQKLYSGEKESVEMTTTSTTTTEKTDLTENEELRTTLEAIDGLGESGNETVFIEVKEAIPISQLDITNDTLCNNEDLRALINENIDGNLNTSKRLIQLAAEAQFGGQFDVICASNDFSYVTNTELYCQETKGDISCYAYRQI